jgi:hypothetical protein
MCVGVVWMVSYAHGTVNARRYWAGDDKAGIDKGKDYFHSSFIDLIIGGLIGVKIAPRPNQTRVTTAQLMQVEISPLIPQSLLDDLPYFALDGVKTIAGDVAVVYDSTGGQYAKGVGMVLMVDGATVAHRSTIGRIVWPIPPPPPTPPTPPPPTPPPTLAPTPPAAPSGYQVQQQ